MKTGLLAIALFVLGCLAGSCAVKEVEAEAAYGGMQELLCVAPEPILGPTATKEERAAAWARVDACRLKVQERWGVKQTFAEAGHD